MTVYKRGDIYHYAFMIRGEHYRGTTGHKTLTKARAVESEKMAQVLERGADPRMKKSPLLSIAASQFLAEIEKRVAAGNLAPNTLRSYKDGWKLLSQSNLAGMRVDQITTGIAAGFSFPGGPWNARKAQTTLSRMLGWCTENGYLRTAPKIKRAKASGRSLRLERWMEEALLKHMERDVADVFVIMLDCGMRPEEVMRMQWKNIHWNRNEYFNPFGKTVESRRFVPMAERMCKVLRARENNGSVWVFPSRGIDPSIFAKGRELFAAGATIRAVSMAIGISWPIAKQIRDGRKEDVRDKHRVSVAIQWEEARAAAGLDPKLVLYCARHEFATTFLENGGNLGSLMKIMGHTSITTTQKYLHNDIRGAADIINRRNLNTGIKLVKKA